MGVFSVIRRHTWWVVLALGLVGIESLAWIVEPTVFGEALDAWIDRAADPTSPSPWWPVAIWIGAYLVNSAAGVVRRVLDTRIFLRIYTDIATHVAEIALQQSLSVSKTAARAELSREFVNFLQYRTPEIIEQVVLIGGALIGLSFFDYRIGVTCFGLIVPLALINVFYNRRVILLQSTLHDTMEDAYDIFAVRDPQKVRAYYADQMRPQYKISNWGAAAFGTLRFVLLIIFLTVLYISIDLDGFTTGQLVSIVAYIWTFITSSEFLPEVMESYTSLKDIARRLKAENM